MWTGECVRALDGDMCRRARLRSDLISNMDVQAWVHVRLGDVRAIQPTDIDGGEESVIRRARWLGSPPILAQLAGHGRTSAADDCHGPTKIKHSC